LFARNPLPLVGLRRRYDVFLEVNDTAVAHDGYSRVEFLRMRISDIQPPEDVPRLEEMVTSIADGTGQGVRRHAGRRRHRLKDSSWK